MSDAMKPLCKCGDELPPAKKGEVLVCVHCGRKYRALGKGKVELATDNLVTEQDGDAEVFRFDDGKDKDEVGDDRFSDKGSTIKVDLREKRRQAEKRRSAVVAKASGQGSLPDGSTRSNAVSGAKPRARSSEIPGGVMPMIVSIIVFNALAFVALALLFPTKDGMTSTPWGTSFAKPKIPWLEMLTLILGHVFGFAAWALYVHQLHKKEKAARAREREIDDDEDEEEKFSRRGV